MKIIDAHMHFSQISTFKECSQRDSVLNYSEAGYKAEARASGIVRSICMGLYECGIDGFPDAKAETPMMADLSGELPSEIDLCLGINPHTLTGGAINKMEDIIRRGKERNGPGIAGIKIYAGYYHFDVNDPIYAPAYDFAEKHGLAVAIHSGDTYSERGKLIYSQPLSIDSLAVDRPDMRIVICHMGAPWLYDACEVAGKNRNVYMDLSGLYVGDKDYFEASMRKPLLIDRYRQALVVMDKYDKVLFGTDWPLAPMASYVEFCKMLVPPETYDIVFYENAMRVFGLR
jgi:predicted TIM-barrel fold metal-dependent hydrolase